MEYTLTDGTTMTPEELSTLVPGITIRNARCRLGRTKVREKLLTPVRTVVGNNRSIKSYTLSNGKEYTVKELMEITGCKYATVVSRLHASKDRDAERILKPGMEPCDKQDSVKGMKIANERMIGDPDGFWRLFNKIA